MIKQFKIIFLTLVIFYAASTVKAQTIKLLTSGTGASIRGLSVVNDKVIW